MTRGLDLLCSNASAGIQTAAITGSLLLLHDSWVVLRSRSVVNDDVLACHATSDHILNTIDGIDWLAQVLTWIFVNRIFRILDMRDIWRSWVFQGLILLVSVLGSATFWHQVWVHFYRRHTRFFRCLLWFGWILDWWFVACCEIRSLCICVRFLYADVHVFKFFGVLSMLLRWAFNRCRPHFNVIATIGIRLDLLRSQHALGSEGLVSIGEEFTAHAPSGSCPICQKSLGCVRWLARAADVRWVAVGSAVSCSLILVLGRSGRWQHMAFLAVVESLIVLVACLVNPSSTMCHVASSFLKLFLSGLVQMVAGRILVFWHVHFQTLYLRHHHLIRARNWTSFMQILVWVVIQDLIGGSWVVLCLVRPDVFLGSFAWLLHQDLLLRDARPTLCQSIPRTVIARHYCAIHGNGLIVDDVLRVDSGCRLEWRRVVRWCSLGHALRVLHNTNLSVLIGWERLISPLIWPNRATKSSNIRIVLVHALFVDFL